MINRKLQYSEERLLEYRLLLLGKIEETKKSLKLLSADKPRDSGDRIEEFRATNLSLSQFSLQRGLLRSVEEALSGVKRGTYGQCQGCGRPIGVSRLTVIPWARLCLRCGHLEEKEDSFGSGAVCRAYRAVA